MKPSEGQSYTHSRAYCLSSSPDSDLNFSFSSSSRSTSPCDVRLKRNRKIPLPFEIPRQCTENTSLSDLFSSCCTVMQIGEVNNNISDFFYLVWRSWLLLRLPLFFRGMRGQKLQIPLPKSLFLRSGKAKVWRGARRRMGKVIVAMIFQFQSSEVNFSLFFMGIAFYDESWS